MLVAGSRDKLEVLASELRESAHVSVHVEAVDLSELNVAALTELTCALLPGMRARDGGAIVNVASTAAFQPVPYMAV